MECIERFLEDMDEICNRVHCELEKVFNSVQMIQGKDGVWRPKGFMESNIDVKSNIALVKWWHFQWFMNAQVKLFGRCVIY